MTRVIKFQPVEVQPNFPEIEEKILEFWQDNKIFEKSIYQRSPKNAYSFYDGPPFVTGVPHYGSLLSSIAKDVVPRYWTMKGKRVRRVWGWDCHGLPIENKVEEKLKLKSKRDIEKIGIKKFITECFNYVATTSPEWEWYINHIGRWVDFKNAYKTMDRDYMETVMWVFKEIYNKGLIYQGKRVSLFCPHCSTPVSNFEIAMDNSYIDLTESSSTYKYQLTQEPNTFVLAWSTTPWNKLATPALAYNPKLVYVKVQQGNEYYILAKSTLKMLNGKYKIVDEFKGNKLEGLHFIPHWDFYHVKNKPTAYRLYGADFVTAEEGTGMVTIAAYGEEDYKLMTEKNIPIIEHVDETGHLKPEVIPWAGKYYLDVDPLVNKDLADRNLLYSEKSYTHSVPVCWRCQTRLIYAPQNAWFLAVSKLKDKMLEVNKRINWVPKHFKYGRFKKGIENAPDWCISRSRYWGSPMPVWECQCGERFIIGSIQELEKLSQRQVTDLHRPYIDEVFIPCHKCGKKAKRITDVLDCWVESGSMPYAERHYPFENKEEFELSFPADYVSEYVAQTRAWFYVMHVISTALFDSHSFKNVVVTGVIMGTDGRKMSKSYGNYPDPKKTLKQHGGDALRLYLLGSQLMIGKDININEQGMIDAVKTTLLPLWNCYRYFVSFAQQYNFSPTSLKMTNILDRWIIFRLKQFNHMMNQLMDSYQITASVRLIQPFIADLSNWYIRRSRTRFVDGDKEALNVLHTVLVQFSLLTAPIIPFIAEEMYRNLQVKQGIQSIHLQDFPMAEKLSPEENNLLDLMQAVRQVCLMGNAERKKLGIKVRQPLKELRIMNEELRIKLNKSPYKNELLNLIKDELNVKEVEFDGGKENKVIFDTKLTPELKAEGEARELIRLIQANRKKVGCTFEDKIVVWASSWPKAWETEIKRRAIVAKLVKHPTFKIEKC